MLVRFIQAAILCGVTCLFPQVGSGQILSLQTSTGTIANGAVVTLDLAWDAQGGTAPAALQWTVSYSSPDVYLLQTTLGEAGSGAGKRLTCHPGLESITCVLFGSDAAPIGNGPVARMTFATTTTFSGFTFVSLSRAAAASPDGTPINISESGTGLGTSSVTGLSPAPGCTYSIELTGTVLSASGGETTFWVETGPQCPWQAGGTVPWLSTNPPSSGTGPGSFTVRAAQNTGPARAGTILIAGSAQSLMQMAADGSLPQPGFAGSGAAHIVSGGSWKTTITLMNTGTTQASAHLYFFDNAGMPLSLAWNFPQSGPGAPAPEVTTVTRTIDPGKLVVMETSGNGALTEGWAQLHSTGPLQGFAIFTNVLTHQEAVVPLESAGEYQRLLAFDNTGSTETGVAMANLSMHAIEVTATFRDHAGTTLGTAFLPIAARGHSSFMLRPAFGMTAGQRGTMEFQTSYGARIAVVGLRADGPAFTTLPILSDTGGDGTGSIAQVISGAGWKTTLTLVNARPDTGESSTRWFDDAGVPLTLSILDVSTGAITNSSSTSGIVPGLSSVTLETPPVDGPVLGVGSVQIAAPGMNGIAIYRSNVTGQQVAVPLESRRAGSYVLVFDNTNTLITGVGIANLDGHEANISVTVRDDTGTLLSSDAIQLPANGHTSFLIGQRYPSSANLLGSLSLATSGGARISVIGIRATVAGTLTALPPFARSD